VRIAPFVSALLLVAPLAAADDRPPLQTLLDRVTEYVVRYEREVSGVVAEERYVQDADKSDRPFVTHRELKSDLLLVRTEGGADAYVQFRDVFEVDGRPVRDRQDRLTNLFLHPGPGGPHPETIVAESARYNIGRVERNINVPLMALMFLDPSFRPRFKYSADTEHKGTPRGMPKSDAFKLLADAWEIDFEETGSPTVIRGDGQDAKSRGRIWIDPETSRVLMTEIVTEARTVRTTFRVSYQSEPMAGVLLPVEMRETYVLKGRFYTLEGAATYSNFRRFTVETVEKIGEPGLR